MTTQDYHTSISATAAAGNVFNSINNITGWWSEDFSGSVDKQGDIFTVRFGSEVYITSVVEELIPGKKIVWLVTDCNKPWLKNSKEWIGTRMVWEVGEANGQTQVHFTHKGLVPEIECFSACSNAWGQYIQLSLASLIATGEGQPYRKKVEVTTA